MCWNKFLNTAHPNFTPASTAGSRKFLSTSDEWNQASCKKLPLCELLKAFISPKVETHKRVFTHAGKSNLGSVWSTLEQIPFGYFAHWGILALLQLAMQAQSWGVNGGCPAAPLLVMFFASPSSAPHHHSPCNLTEPRFLCKSKQKHSWVWDTVQTPPLEGFSGISRERDAETRHLLQNEN